VKGVLKTNAKDAGQQSPGFGLMLWTLVLTIACAWVLSSDRKKDRVKYGWNSARLELAIGSVKTTGLTD